MCKIGVQLLEEVMQSKKTTHQLKLRRRRRVSGVLLQAIEEARPARILAERPGELGGLRIGFFHNNKPNADALLERIEELLAREDETLRFVRWGKPNPTLPEARLGEFIKQVDAAVCAVGD